MNNNTSVLYSQPSASSGLERRSYQKAYINFNGKTIAIYNTHLFYVSSTDADLSNKITTYLVPEIQELIASLSQETYFILLADSNINCENASSEFYTICQQLFINAGFNIANCSTDFGFRQTCFNTSVLASEPEYIDNIITSGNIDIINMIVDTRKIVASNGAQAIDHLPVISYLNIQ